MFSSLAERLLGVMRVTKALLRTMQSCDMTGAGGHKDDIYERPLYDLCFALYRGLVEVFLDRIGAPRGFRKPV